MQEILCFKFINRYTKVIDLWSYETRKNQCMYSSRNSEVHWKSRARRIALVMELC